MKRRERGFSWGCSIAREREAGGHKEHKRAQRNLRREKTALNNCDALDDRRPGKVFRKE